MRTSYFLWFLVIPSPQRASFVSLHILHLFSLYLPSLLVLTKGWFFLNTRWQNSVLAGCSHPQDFSKFSFLRTSWLWNYDCIMVITIFNLHLVFYITYKITIIATWIHRKSSHNHLYFWIQWSILYRLTIIFMISTLFLLLLYCHWCSVSKTEYCPYNQ